MNFYKLKIIFEVEKQPAYNEGYVIPRNFAYVEGYPDYKYYGVSKEEALGKLMLVGLDLKEKLDCVFRFEFVER